MTPENAPAPPRFTDGFMRIGDGPYGAKEESLKGHSALIRRYGFRIPPTVTVGWKALQKAQEDFSRTVSGAHKGLGSPPYVAVRSSSIGDDTGTGVFYSALIRYCNEHLAAAQIRTVAASHGTEHARHFRAELGISDGIAAMLQPVVGSYMDIPAVGAQEGMRVFGPLWSCIVHTQLPQKVVLNPGLLRPYTAENKTLVSALHSISSNSAHNAQLFVASGERASLFEPVIIQLPGNLLTQKAPLKTIEHISGIFDSIKNELGADVYAEICISADGTAHVVQFAKLPPLPKLENKPSPTHRATAITLSRGAVKLHQATALHVTDYMDIDAMLAHVKNYGAELPDRSLILIMEDNMFRGLMGKTHELWGSLRSVGALFSVDMMREYNLFECHLSGAMRIARNFGFGRLPKQPHLGEHTDSIVCKDAGRTRPVLIDVYKDCIDAEISEGHGAGFIQRST